MKKYFFAISLLFQFKSYAQNIIYTDISPDDSLYNNNFYNLDLNNDGTTDFEIKNYLRYMDCVCSGANMPFVGINPVLGNQILSNGYVKRLNHNDSIQSSSLTWKADSDQTISIYYSSCVPMHSYCYAPSNANWVFGTDNYVGLRIWFNNHFYYGWVRIEIITPYNTTAIVKDYAYNANSDSSITAGDIGTGIDKYYRNVFKVFPNPNNGKFSLEVSKKSFVNIYDFMGRIILQKPINKEEDKLLDLTKNGKGVYLVRVTDGNKVNASKVVVE